MYMLTLSAAPTVIVLCFDVKAGQALCGIPAVVRAMLPAPKTDVMPTVKQAHAAETIRFTVHVCTYLPVTCLSDTNC